VPVLVLTFVVGMVVSGEARNGAKGSYFFSFHQ
jgi:hypothetical protein